MPLTQWEALTPVLRDAVRINNSWTLPPEAGRWPESAFGWEVLLNRFANQRRVDELWTGRAAPVSIAELTARGVYDAWRSGYFSGHSPEKVLTRRRKQRKSFLSKIMTPLKVLLAYAQFA